MAKLYFRYGAMGSGKTIDLLKVAYNYQERGKNVMILSSAKDNRYGIGKVSTRIGLQQDSISISDNVNVYDIICEQKYNLDAVLVDEAQFFTKKQIYELSDVVDYLDIPVMCYGLRTDFRQKFFPGSEALMEIADNIEEIKTICKCGNKATVNMRFITGKTVIEGNQVLIGGNEIYKSVCRKCYKQYIKSCK